MDDQVKTEKAEQAGLGQPVEPVMVRTTMFGVAQESNRSYIKNLGLRLLGSKPTDVDEPMPIIGLSSENWTVVDVDSDQGLGAFHRRLKSGELPGVVAYVLTDKGVLVVYTKSSEKRCDLDGDIRYERISRERGFYDTRCLSKRDGKPRTMVAIDDKGKELSIAWNSLAAQAERLGDWVLALSTSQAASKSTSRYE